MLRWTFDVERVDVILRHNLEYIVSMSRLPILAPECSKGEGAMPIRRELRLFQGVKVDEID